MMMMNDELSSRGKREEGRGKRRGSSIDVSITFINPSIDQIQIQGS